jgi:hypothetical protein
VYVVHGGDVALGSGRVSHITLDNSDRSSVRGWVHGDQGFAAELVRLTGTSDAAPTPQVPPRRPAADLIELSLVVNFQSLAGGRIYRSIWAPGGSSGAGCRQPRVDDDRLAFHLGGGIQMELDSRWALRLNVRDTFFNEDKSLGNAVDQVTVDSLELSVGLTVKFPVGKPGSSSLQLRGIDAGPIGINSIGYDSPLADWGRGDSRGHGSGSPALGYVPPYSGLGCASFDPRPPSAFPRA